MKGKLHKFGIFFLSLLIVSFAIVNSACERAMISHCEKDYCIYRYNKKDISDLIEYLGWPDEIVHTINWPDIGKNSDGTSIRIRIRNMNKAVIINLDKTIEIIDIPASITYLDKENKPAVWVEDRLIHYRNGFREKITAIKMDWDAEYIVKYTGIGYKVFSIVDPTTPLASVDFIFGGPIKIFSKADRLYLFGFRPGDLQTRSIVFKKDELSLTKEAEIIFPKGSRKPTYGVVDISPAPGDDRVLISGGFDWPHRDKWHLFRLDTGDMEKIGKAHMTGFFLKGDILRDALREARKK